MSEYTRDEIIASAEAVDAHCGTRFADRCRDRVTVSYPPIDSRAYVDLDQADIDAALARRGPRRRTATSCSCPGWRGPRESTT